MEATKDGTRTTRAWTMGLVIAVGLTLGIAGLTPTAGAEDPVTISETKSYAGTSAGLTWLTVPTENPLLLISEDCCHCATQTFTGGAAFCTDAETTQVTVSIADESGLATAGLVQIGDTEETFCGETTVDTGDANEVSVLVGNPASVNIDCPGQGTTGQITATWTLASDGA